MTADVIQLADERAKRTRRRLAAALGLAVLALALWWRLRKAPPAP